MAIRSRCAAPSASEVIWIVDLRRFLTGMNGSLGAVSNFARRRAEKDTATPDSGCCRLDGTHLLRVTAQATEREAHQGQEAFRRAVHF